MATWRATLLEAVASRAACPPAIPSVLPRHPEIASFIRTADRNLACGLLRIVALLVARPMAAYLAFKWFARSQSSSSFQKAVVGAAAFLCACAPARVCRLFGGGYSVGVPAMVSGVFTAGPRSPGDILADRAGLREKTRSYVSPFLNGEWSTIFPAVLGDLKKLGFQLPPGYVKKTVLFESSCAAPGDGEMFVTDWIFPAATSAPADIGVCVFLAGVGGDSEASYIREVAGGMHDKGWVTCAINARGMGDSSPPVKVLLPLVPSYCPVSCPDQISRAPLCPY
jgi:hypothetical protein